jgi:hypothetical protein
MKLHKILLLSLIVLLSFTNSQAQLKYKTLKGYTLGVPCQKSFSVNGTVSGLFGKVSVQPLEKAIAYIYFVPGYRLTDSQIKLFIKNIEDYYNVSFDNYDLNTLKTVYCINLSIERDNVEYRVIIDKPDPLAVNRKVYSDSSFPISFNITDIARQRDVVNKRSPKYLIETNKQDF